MRTRITSWCPLGLPTSWRKTCCAVNSVYSLGSSGVAVPMVRSGRRVGSNQERSCCQRVQVLVWYILLRPKWLLSSSYNGTWTLWGCTRLRTFMVLSNAFTCSIVSAPSTISRNDERRRWKVHLGPGWCSASPRLPPRFWLGVEGCKYLGLGKCTSLEYSRFRESLGFGGFWF